MVGTLTTIRFFPFKATIGPSRTLYSPTTSHVLHWASSQCPISGCMCLGRPDAGKHRPCWRSREFRIGSCGASLLGFSWKCFLALLVRPYVFLFTITRVQTTRHYGKEGHYWGRSSTWLGREVRVLRGIAIYPYQSELHLRLPQILVSGRGIHKFDSLPPFDVKHCNLLQSACSQLLHCCTCCLTYNSLSLTT